MNRKTRSAGIDKLLREIVGPADPGRLRDREIKSLARQFDDIAKRNYPGQLRNHFSAHEIHGLVAALEMNVPALNRKTFRDTNQTWLRRQAARLGVEVNAVPFGREQENLRGFYVPSHGVRERPTMWLNTAHHRVAIASTFWHELGHHVLDRLGEKAESIALFYRDDYNAHMTDLSELTADIILVLAVYPKAAAARLFDAYLKAERSPTAYELAAGAQNYLFSIAGFQFEKEFPKAGNLHYLAGMIHYAKLRWALMAEYNI
jgi:hypothetical protein